MGSGTRTPSQVRIISKYCWQLTSTIFTSKLNRAFQKKRNLQPSPRGTKLKIPMPGKTDWTDMFGQVKSGQIDSNGRQTVQCRLASAFRCKRVGAQNGLDGQSFYRAAVTNNFIQDSKEGWKVGLALQRNPPKQNFLSQRYRWMFLEYRNSRILVLELTSLVDS